MTPEEARLELDREEFNRRWEMEERKFRAELVSKKWTQISTFVPILVIIVGYFVSTELESSKQQARRESAENSQKVEYIDRQLSTFYYPIQLRLRKDSAIWKLSNQISKDGAASSDPIFSRYIENSVLLPNHDKVVAILTENIGLVRNAWEDYDARPLFDAIDRYQRHVTVYKALREQGDYSRNPRAVCEGCEYPKDFESLIEERVKSLENQRSGLKLE